MTNVLYNVGSRDEAPDKTGLAHLFEHLMFAGSANIPDFDQLIHEAGGDNNAFTNQDITSYYDVLPANNLTTAFYIESERMHRLKVTKTKLETQKSVVIEEFKESLDEPYGDAPHHIANMAYDYHPYRWPTIGLNALHIKQTTLKDVKQFYKNYYHPSNAILVVAGHIKDIEATKADIAYWFGDIPAGPVYHRNIASELPLREMKNLTIERVDLPIESFFLLYPSPKRTDRGFYVADLLTDMLTGNSTSFLEQSLIVEQEMLASVDAYVTGYADDGLIIIEGQVLPGYSVEMAVQKTKEALSKFSESTQIDERLKKVKEHAKTYHLFAETNVMNKASKLAYYEWLGDAQQINHELDIMTSIIPEEIRALAKSTFQTDHQGLLVYRKV